jgi:hypothetical protein
MIIVRTAWKRPAILKLSLESQMNADLFEDTKTIIFVDKSSAQNTKDITDVINGFDADIEIVFREEHYGVNKNPLEAFKYVYDKYGVEYLVLIEEDVLVAKDFFSLLKYCMDQGWFWKEKCMGMVGGFDGDKWGTDINKIHLAKWFDTRLMALNKENFYKYVEVHCNQEYYRTPMDYINRCFNETKYYTFDWLLGRLTQDNELFCIFPEIHRYGYIGVFGSGTSKSEIEQKSYQEQYEILKQSQYCASLLTKISAPNNQAIFRDFDPNIKSTDYFMAVNHLLY